MNVTIKDENNIPKLMKSLKKLNGSTISVGIPDEKKNKDIDYIESKFKSKELTKEKATSLKKTIESDFNSAIDKLMNFDANTYAVLKGYDAIYQSKGGKKAYTVILNRTKVIIKDGRS